MTPSRLLLIVLTAWGLVMIVPDLLRLGAPLGSLGFFIDNDGLIHHVNGPFPAGTSPASRAGIEIGDRLDLQGMRCTLHDIEQCGSTLSLLGGMDYLLPGREVTLDLLPNGEKPARRLTLTAEQPPSNILIRAVNVLCQIAGILVILAAAWLVWTRPSAMSWGFFLYVNWFNPGQIYAFYAILDRWPLALLAQDIASVLAQSAGYAGLLLFVLRVPNNQTEARWRDLERALPLVAFLYALVLAASYGSLFGFPSETVTRVSILAGFLVDFAALGILLARRRTQAPEDYQRVRWVIWGCLIGLPAFLIADLASQTTIFETRWGDFTPSQDVIGLLYLVNGVLCLFVFQAISRRRVVNVMIPLRRVTILGLTLSIPVLLMHHEVERIQEHLGLPQWAWLLVGAAAVYALTRLHEGAVHLADRYFNREVDAAWRRLGAEIRHASKAADIDRLLADETFEALKLASAASFRKQGNAFARASDGKGWENGTARTITVDEPMLAPVRHGKPFPVEDDDGNGPSLPEGLLRPVLAVPAVNPVRCFALSLYGPHASGTDLDVYERKMLAGLAADAAAMYAELENSDLRGEIARLERKLDAAKPTSGVTKGSVHGDL